MAGKAITRAFLILALIVTAHIIKPFSIKSVTRHLLYSARSFKFVLPVRLRDKFDHANYLAINLSDSLFEAGKGIQHFAKDTAADFGFVAINVQPLDEVNKSATKRKSGAKKSAPAKRVIRSEKNEIADLPNLSGLVASVNSDEIMPVELPPAPEIEATRIMAPVIQPCPMKLFPARMITVVQARPVEVLLALRNNDCEKRTVEKRLWIGLIEEKKGSKASIRIVEKPSAKKASLGALECEERKTEVATEDFEIEIAEPEEEIIAPQPTEELKAGSLSNPFERCSKEP